MLAHAVQALGVSESKVIPQNCDLPDKCSKYCGLGCAHGGKQDVLRTWLADAAATGNATILTNTTARRILTQKISGETPQQGGAPQGDGSGAVARSSAVQGALLHMVRSDDVCSDDVRSDEFSQLSAVCMQPLAVDHFPVGIPCWCICADSGRVAIRHWP